MTQPTEPMTANQLYKQIKRLESDCILRPGHEKWDVIYAAIDSFKSQAPSDLQRQLEEARQEIERLTKALEFEQENSDIFKLAMERHKADHAAQRNRAEVAEAEVERLKEYEFKYKELCK